MNNKDYPSRETVKFTVLMPAELHKKFKKLSLQNKTSLTKLTNKLIEQLCDYYQKIEENFEQFKRK